MAHATASRGPTTETPLTREAMAELLELHRAGQQVDREAEASAQADLLRSMIEAQVHDAVRRATLDIPLRVGESVAATFAENKRVRRSLMFVVSNGTAAGVLLALLIASVLSFFVSVWVATPSNQYWIWRAVNPSVHDGDAADQAMKRRLFAN